MAKPGRPKKNTFSSLHRNDPIGSDRAVPAMATPPRSPPIPSSVTIEASDGVASVTPEQAGIPGAPQATSGIEDALFSVTGPVDDPKPQRPPDSMAFDSPGFGESIQTSEAPADSPVDDVRPISAEDEAEAAANDPDEPEDMEPDPEPEPRAAVKGEKKAYVKVARTIVKAIDKSLNTLTRAILTGKLTKQEIVEFMAENANDQDELDGIIDPLAEVLAENKSSIKTMDLLIFMVLMVFGTRLAAIFFELRRLNIADAEKAERAKGPARAQVIEGEFSVNR